MFFDNNLLSIRQNGRFAKCWLAATNPKAFRSYVKRIDLEKIQISNVCEEIIDTLMKNSRNPKKRLTLYLAAQLVFGTVCIYQQQVLFLYEKTNNLLSVNRYFETTTLFKKKRNLPLEKTCAKRRKLMDNNNLTETEKLLGPNTIEEIQKEVIIVQMPPAIEAVRGSYLINDVNWSMPEPPEPELFGEMSQNELQDFLDIFEGRKSMAHICSEQIEDTSHKPSEYNASEQDEMDIPIKTLQDIARNKRNKERKTLYSKPLEVQQDEEGRVALPVPNEEIQQCNNEDITANTTQTSTKNIIEHNTTEHNHLGITICQDIQISPPVLDRNCDISTIQEMDITTTETPKQAAKRKLDETDIDLENLPKALVNSIFSQRKRKKQSKLKIDNNTKISANLLIKQIECTENILRCLDPRDDIIPSHLIKTKTVDKMFLTSCRKIPSISINSRFGNNLKIIRLKKDPNILKKILDQPIDENEEQNLGANCEQINLINDSRIEVAQQNVTQNIDLVVEASRIVENEEDIALPLNLKNDLLLNFSKENQQKDINQQATDVNFNITQTDIKSCDREAIVRKLLYFWKKDTHPINMKTLCDRSNRKYAARTFSSIIELSAYKYINIIKYNDNIEIYHIEMGERIVQNLNENL